MELPSFDLLWQTSEQLDELECVLEQIDRVASHKKLRGKRRFRKHREGLYGVTFDIEDRDYYEPLRYCCDEAFYTEQEYEEHVARHRECDVEGCPFVGYGRILRIHTEVVHAGGFYSQIYRETSDKAILEWRAERRRNYPTLERAAAKRELLAQRLARGQVFKTQEFGTIKRKHPPILSERDLGSSIPAASPDESCPPDPPSTAVQSEEDRDAVPECISQISPNIASGPGERQALVGCSLVAADYDTDDSNSDKGDSLDVTPSTEAVKKVEPVISIMKTSRGRRQRGGRRRTAKRNRRIIEAAAAKNTAPTEEQIPAPPSTEKDPFASHPVVQMAMKRRLVSKNPDRIHSRPTLLHMLLATEMRTERNQLMHFWQPK